VEASAERLGQRNKEEERKPIAPARIRSKNRVRIKNEEPRTAAKA
jgi:hypothetical protein